jgi:Tol biopolymer transport system component/DNA-binding winged helix-turn-helix (wHTH) protein
MPPGVHQTEKVRFGVFEADLRAGELRKYGVRIRLQRQPFNILAALLERPGDLVTREELRQRIWGPDTVVDFDHSLGTAINKLREALSDSAETPRYVETLAKRGFRFIAPVEHLSTPPSREPEEPAPQSVAVELEKVEPAVPIAVPPEPAPAVPAEVPSPAMLTPQVVVAPRSIYLGRLAVVLGVLALVAGATWVWSMRQTRPASAVSFRAVTADYHVYPGQINIERFPGVATDGLRVFFPELQNGRVGLASVLIGGGEIHPFPLPPEILRPSVADISRDGAELLIRSLMWSQTEQPLWIAPSTGGSARKLFDVMAHDAAWTPDRSAVLYASGEGLFLIGRTGGARRKLAGLPGRAYWIRYSPDGTKIRFTLLDPKTRATSLWEIAPDGANPHPILESWTQHPAECCGTWTTDGRNFIFQSGHSGRPNVWTLPEGGSRFGRTPAPFQITAGPLDYLAPVPAIRDNQVFAIGANSHRELFHFESVSHSLQPYLKNVRGARRAETSHHTDQVIWISSSDETLWHGNSDGGERVQLTASPLTVYMARWSPDDRRLAVMAKAPGSPYQIYTISPDGGDLQPLFEEPRNQADPDWGPQGKAIVFGRFPDYAAEASTQKDIRILDLETKAISVLPGSTGMFSPRWSPDGRYIAAMTLDQHSLLVFDRTTVKWSKVAEGTIHNPVWSRDGKFLYFQALEEDEVPIWRVSIDTRRLERICDRRISVTADTIDFVGLAPDGNPIGALVFWAADVYGMNWK